MPITDQVSENNQQNEYNLNEEKTVERNLLMRIKESEEIINLCSAESEATIIKKTNKMFEI